MTTTPRHVVIGTGAIGLATLDALRRRGQTARDPAFDEPFVGDSSRITDELGVAATPVEQALADTLREYRHD